MLEHKILIRELLLELLGRAWRCLSLSLAETIPTYLCHVLLRYTIKGGRYRRSTHTSRNTLENVYDLLDVGSRNRFMVWGDYPFLVSNCAQSTAHDIHILATGKLDRKLREREVDFYWMISDFHDQFLLAVREGSEQVVIDAIAEVVREVNLELDAKVKLKMVGEVVETLADAKL